MDTNTNPEVPKKKLSFGQKLKKMFSRKKTSKTTGQTVVEEKHEKHVDTHVHQQVAVPPGPALIPAVAVPVVGAPAPQPLTQAPALNPITNAIKEQTLTEKQAFGSIIESKAMPLAGIPAQPILAGPAPVPLQQVPQPAVQLPPPIVEALPPPRVAPLPQPVDLYKPVGGILPEPVTLSVMGPVHKPVVGVEEINVTTETKRLTGGGIPVETGGMVYNGPVIQANQGQFTTQDQAMFAPHLRNIVEITGTNPPTDLTYPRDQIIGPAVKTNPTFVENLPNLKKDHEYISRHLAENNAAKPSPFHQMREFGKIPNPAYAGGKPFFVDMLYNPDPLVPLSEYPEAYQHLPLQLIGQKNAELHQINKMNEVAIKEHKEVMRNQDRF